MKVVFAPLALGDIDRILSYIHQRNPRGAQNVSLAIEHAIEMCRFIPRTGASTDIENLYRRPLGKYRYTIFYRWMPGRDVVEVVRVIHGARIKNLKQVPDDIS
jgi:plasmid stabilization system protein ParE